MIFKKGDIVECVYDFVSAKELIKGKECIIEKIDMHNHVWLVGVNGNWAPNRFRPTKNAIVKRILEDL